MRSGIATYRAGLRKSLNSAIGWGWACGINTAAATSAAVHGQWWAAAAFAVISLICFLLARFIGETLLDEIVIEHQVAAGNIVTGRGGLAPTIKWSKPEDPNQWSPPHA